MTHFGPSTQSEARAATSRLRLTTCLFGGQFLFFLLPSFPVRPPHKILRYPYSDIFNLYTSHLISSPKKPRKNFQTTQTIIMPGYIVSCIVLPSYLHLADDVQGHPEARFHRRADRSVRFSPLHLLPMPYLTRLHSAKKHAVDQGGVITHEYTIFKGFAYVPLCSAHHCMNGVEWDADTLVVSPSIRTR